ncbi:hypothetical protein [uncultured Clostridium sp.]|uniref:hypothetical protein n=1 Tax=uncultured Clostridium sp. TaxID=59620 RepID=UPI0025FBDFCF|nr:hypothetical protein [uncultured Clostridium sp.]
MKKITLKIISIIFSILVFTSVVFSTNANAQEPIQNTTTTSNSIIKDRFYYKIPNNPVEKNILTNYITVNCGIYGSTVKVTVRNVAIDSLDSMVVNIKIYRNGTLDINRTFREYDIPPFSAPTFEASLPGLSHADITVTTTDGGESYTKYYTVRA